MNQKVLAWINRRNALMFSEYGDDFYDWLFDVKTTKTKSKYPQYHAKVSHYYSGGIECISVTLLEKTSWIGPWMSLGEDHETIRMDGEGGTGRISNQIKRLARGIYLQYQDCMSKYNRGLMIKGLSGPIDPRIPLE